MLVAGGGNRGRNEEEYPELERFFVLVSKKEQWHDTGVGGLLVELGGAADEDDQAGPELFLRVSDLRDVGTGYGKRRCDPLMALRAPWDHGLPLTPRVVPARGFYS